MKDIAFWLKEKEVFHLTDEQLIEAIQKEAFNSGVRAAFKKVRLTIDGTPIGKFHQTYSPSKGIRNIAIDEQSILGLIID